MNVLDAVRVQMEHMRATSCIPRGNTQLVIPERDRGQIMRDVARHLNIPEDQVTPGNLDAQLDRLGLTVEFAPDHWSSDPT